MAAAELKKILITIISLLMVPETFSPCLVIVVCGSVTAGLCDASSVLAKKVVRSACMKHYCFQLQPPDSLLTGAKTEPSA